MSNELDSNSNTDGNEISLIEELPSPDGKSAKCSKCGVGVMDRLATSFEASARRWEIIVYPSLIAFMILAAYGFFLIYSLSRDVQTVAGSMQAITDNMVVVAGNMTRVSEEMQAMTGYVSTQSSSLESLVHTTREMNQSVGVMTASVDQMRHHIGSMNHNVSRPMNFMNSFLPW